MKIKQILKAGIVNCENEETGDVHIFYKCSAFVSGETGFMHTFVSDRVIKVGDSVRFPEWVLSENMYVDKKGKIHIELICEEQ